jgi:hypothetical protein
MWYGCRGLQNHLAADGRTHRKSKTTFRHIQKDHPNSAHWLNKNYIDAPEMGVHLSLRTIPCTPMVVLGIGLAVLCIHKYIHNTSIYTLQSLLTVITHIQKSSTEQCTSVQHRSWWSPKKILSLLVTVKLRVLLALHLNKSAIYWIKHEHLQRAASYFYFSVQNSRMHTYKTYFGKSNFKKFWRIKARLTSSPTPVPPNIQNYHNWTSRLQTLLGQISNTRHSDGLFQWGGGFFTEEHFKRLNKKILQYSEVKQ